MSAITLQEKYRKEVAPAMQKKFGYGNVMAVPRIKKVIVNSGVGKYREDKQQEEIAKYLGLITGQKVSPRPARQSIASFKVREGQTVGFKVTLRGPRMYDFLTRLVTSAIPRMRDFRGIPTRGIAKGGVLTIGIKEHIIFPETIGEDVRTIFGMEVTIVTDSKSPEETVELFKQLGFPLEKKE